MKPRHIVGPYIGLAVMCATTALAGPSPPTVTTPARPLATQSPASAAPATPDPYAVFGASMRAMRAAHALERPPYLAYKLSIDTHNIQIKPVHTKDGSGFDAVLDHANHHYEYQVWLRTKDDKALSQDLDTHEAVSETLFELAPVSLDETPASPGPSPSPVQSREPSIASPPVLGTLSVSASRFYRITFVGLEPVEDTPAYHLHLVALSDDKKHPLTDLWIDPQTYLIRKASAAATYRAVAAGGGGEGDATFGKVGNSWLVTGFDLVVRGYALVWHANVGIVMRAYDIMPLASLPDSYFATPAPTPRAGAARSHS